MSIAPFLPGIPALVPTDGQVPDQPTGENPDGQPGFGDAFAAALAGALAVPAATLPVLTSVATVAAPAPASAEPSAEGSAAVQPLDVPLSTRDLGVPTRDLGVPTRDLGVPTRDLGVPTPAPSVSPAPSPALDDAAAHDAPAATTARDTPAVASRLVMVADPAARQRPADPDVLPPTVSQSPDSTVGSPDSTVGSPNSTVGTPNSTVGKAVVQQVFPEVTRLVSTASNGTHRITLTLQPEQLGEVRVTLVVRDGSVHVRLAGGDGVEGAAVHRALAGGAPELQRLLERTGAEARVSVRDPFAPLLSSGPGPTASVQPAATAAQPGLHTGPDAQAREGQPREQAPREQPTRDQPRRQEPRQPSYLTEPTPATGRLDRTV
ncbi:flagellar hook-length control protein FliK [Nocardioides sp. LML1-1-1.1]|uniref:flagellar hook-length control protein FliK n=1 Tax=Nocardioides sp. LML1-1-1.1 TaxID=3135248 RepID=UPI00342F738C